jgi:hypothetical protein
MSIKFHPAAWDRTLEGTSSSPLHFIDGIRRGIESAFQNFLDENKGISEGRISHKFLSYVDQGFSGIGSRVYIESAEISIVTTMIQKHLEKESGYYSDPDCVQVEDAPKTFWIDEDYRLKRTFLDVYFVIDKTYHEEVRLFISETEEKV